MDRHEGFQDDSVGDDEARRSPRSTASTCRHPCPARSELPGRKLPRRTAAEGARAALEAARQQRHENVISEPRTLGFGVIRAEEPLNGQRFYVAVTDGERNAAVTITLTNTLILELGVKGEHTSTYVIERIDKFAASIKADNGYEDVLAAHPYTFVA